ncbi:MAG: RNA 3'-terminal phosphate cyclase [Nitrospira sp.]|nr:RNA 3'-terminal phosphate cyclase [Nitrospira sp.]
MIEIDGSRYAGSGTIVRQAVAFAALTGQPLHIINARVRRPNPGLRPQHIGVVEAIRDVVNGTAEGLSPGSQELWFRPGHPRAERRYVWEIGTAGSTTMLGLALLPVLAFAPVPVSVELRGGLFQDFAPSVFHLQYVIVPLLKRMGLCVDVRMERPGYVPKGKGILRLTVTPLRRPLQSVTLEQAGAVRRIWGIALASHLCERRVSQRMAAAAKQVIERAGYEAEIEERDETSSLQPGAALALFADLEGGIRLGSDQAGALRRTAESIGQHVATQLLEDLKTGATLDRFAVDQVMPFAALAKGESRFLAPAVTEHLTTGAWLVEQCLGAKVKIDGRLVCVAGIGFRGFASITDTEEPNTA